MGSGASQAVSANADLILCSFERSLLAFSLFKGLFGGADRQLEVRRIHSSFPPVIGFGFLGWRFLLVFARKDHSL
jgi:hypothetical protein